MGYIVHSALSRRVTHVRVPLNFIGSSYFIGEKTYPIQSIEILSDFDSAGSFHIVGEDGNAKYCLVEKCAHLGGGNWILLESVSDSGEYQIMRSITTETTHVMAPPDPSAQHITARRIYRIRTIDMRPTNSYTGSTFFLTNDEGRECFCLERNCSVAGGSGWTFLKTNTNNMKHYDYESANLFLLTEGAEAGAWVTRESSDKLVFLCDSVYEKPIVGGFTHKPSALRDECVQACSYSTHAGAFFLKTDAIETMDGFVFKNERVIDDVTETIKHPVLYSRRGHYNLVALYDGDFASSECDDVYHGYVYSGETAYFYDSTSEVVVVMGEYYRNEDVVRDSGFIYNDNIDRWVKRPEMRAGYGHYSDQDRSDGATVRFGVEVEKEDEDVLNSIGHEELFNETEWAKESDGSLDSETGYELVSPMYNLLDLTRFNSDISNRHIRNHINADYSDSCGGHISVSHTEYTPKELFTGLCGFLPLLYALYPSRIGQTYSQAKCKGEMMSRPEKYSAALIKSKCVEFRIFPAVRNVDNLLWRLELLRIMIHSINSSEDSVLRSIVNKNSKLHKHLVALYNKRSEDPSEGIMQLASRFVEASRKYNSINLNASFDKLKKKDDKNNTNNTNNTNN